MSLILAIDPGSNKCGLAWFKDGLLVKTETRCTTSDTPLKRRLEIGSFLCDEIENADFIISEEPFLLGQNNNGMQRLLGYIEQITNGDVTFIHPMSVKKAMGRGSLDKEEVKTAVSKMLTDEDLKSFGIGNYESLFLSKRYDETDAIAIGLTYLIQIGQRKGPKVIQKKKKKVKNKK